MATTSFIDVPEGHDFPIQNLPYGIFSTPHTNPRVGVAIGDYVLDLSLLAEAGLFSDFDEAESCFQQPSLNAFMSQSRSIWTSTRQTLQDLLSTTGTNDRLRNDKALQSKVLIPMSKVTMHLPAKIGDYTDFYSSREHATNVGIMFRGKDNALQPNWLHLPVGYHGRASSVVISGTQVVRPQGQLQADPTDDSKGSIHGPCRLLDFELEVGTFVGGKPNALGRPLTMQEADDHIFGLVLMNDWSARDVQKWEYVPLGPFTAKNFATTISPWVVTLDALRPFICETSAVKQDNPVPLPYLQDPNYSSYNINLEVALQTANLLEPHPITKSNFRHLYWNIRQQLVHHTVTGCNLQPGDLLGSGTISGADDSALGSMLELSWKGTREIKLPDGSSRKFLQDGDNVVLRGWSQGDGYRIGFGKCEGQVLPAGSPVPDAPPSDGVGAAPRYTDLKLYNYWRSSASWRVRLALAIKGLNYEYIPIHLAKGEQNSDTYKAINPLGQVPVLEMKDLATGEVIRLTQSLPIIEFLDEAFPHTAPICPRHDPLKKAQSKKIAEIVNAGIQPLQNLGVIEKITKESGGAYDGKAFGKDMIIKGLDVLETVVGETAGRYCVGNSVTIADLTLIPQLYNARRFAVDLTPYPTLTRIESALQTLPIFQKAHADAQSDATP